ncbi:hypothetical protein HMPREF2861_06535 [Lactobacillus sp. HMSC068F07]|nr:hypothetical protein HMPREF2861_06535 [Lactobacillus sp. HMSC068F07]
MRLRSAATLIGSGRGSPKRAHRPRSLHIRTSSLNGQGPARSLMLSETRSQAQKPPHKDLGPKWPKPSHLGPRPLMLRFLTGPVRALKKTTDAVSGLGG